MEISAIHLGLWEYIFIFILQWFKCTESQEISGCGKVYQITPAAILGNQFQIAYVPGPNIQYPPETRIWRVISHTSCFNGCQIEVNGTERHTEIYDFAKKEYVLTIQRLTQKYIKSFYVQCGPSLRTENIDIVVLEKPSQPVISSPQHFQHICSDCLALLLETPARLRCNVVRGTTPISMKLYLDGILFASKPDTRSLSKLTPVINEMHGYNITCEVSNAALSSPLISSKTVYVVLSPSTPVLNSDGLKRGQPGNVSCESSGTRPAASPYLYLDNTPKSAEKSVTFDEQTGEYSVTTWTDEINENYEGHNLMCCVTHITIPIATPLCTAIQKIKFKYPPENLELKIEGPSKLEDTYFYLATCHVDESYPECTLRWNASAELAYTIGIAGKLRETAVINVTRFDNGKILQCRADCPDFPDIGLQSNVKVRLMFAPVIDINTTGVVKVREGDPVVLPCYVESLPHPETRWVFSVGGSKHENLTYCGFQYSCMLRIPSAKKNDSGKYTCLADNKIFNESSKEIELIVEEIILPTTQITTATETQDKLMTDEDDAATWLGVGVAVFLLCLLIIVVGVIVVKRKRKGDKKNVQGSVSSPDENHYKRDYETGQDVNVDNNDDAQYAVVIPKSQRKTEPVDDRSTQVDGKELVYADLDIDGPCSDKTTPAVNRKESATEYAVIEFSQKTEVSHDIVTENPDIPVTDKS